MRWALRQRVGSVGPLGRVPSGGGAGGGARLFPLLPIDVAFCACSFLALLEVASMHQTSSANARLMDDYLARAMCVRQDPGHENTLFMPFANALSLALRLLATHARHLREVAFHWPTVAPSKSPLALSERQKAWVADQLVALVARNAASLRRVSWCHGDPRSNIRMLLALSECALLDELSTRLSYLRGPVSGGHAGVRQCHVRDLPGAHHTKPCQLFAGCRRPKLDAFPSSLPQRRRHEAQTQEQIC